MKLDAQILQNILEYRQCLTADRMAKAEDDCFTIYTDPDDFNAVADALTAKGYSFVSAQIEMVPQNYQKLENEEQISLMEKLLDIMEDDDDVQNVWHNWEE